MAQLLPLLGVGKAAMGGLSTIATIAGPLLGIAGAASRVAEGNRQAGEYNRQAKEERVSASVRAARMRREARLSASRDRVMMLEGGAYSGTAYGVLRQNEASAEVDALTTIYQGEQAALGSEARAQASRVSPLTIFSAAIEEFSDMDPLNIGGRI